MTYTVPLIVGEDDVTGYLMKQGFPDSFGFIARLRDTAYSIYLSSFYWKLNPSLFFSIWFILGYYLVDFGILFGGSKNILYFKFSPKLYDFYIKKL